MLGAWPVCSRTTLHHAAAIMLRDQLSTCVVARNHQAGVASHGDAADGHTHFRHKLAAAGVGCQVPHPDVALLVPCSDIAKNHVRLQAGTVPPALVTGPATYRRYAAQLRAGAASSIMMAGSAASLLQPSKACQLPTSKQAG